MRVEYYVLRDGRVAEIAHPLAEEAGEIVAFLNEAAGETGFLDFRRGEYVYSVAEQKALIAECGRGEGYMLNARADGRLVANLFLFPLDTARGIVEFGMCVARSHWGLGIGTRMLSRMIAWARSRRLAEIRLAVHRENHAARALYERLGFHHDPALDAAGALGMKMAIA